MNFSMPKIKISPKNMMTQGVVIMGYITNNTHTMLQISGVSMLDLSMLAQIGALNKTIANNAVVINLQEFNFSVFD